MDRQSLSKFLHEIAEQAAPQKEIDLWPAIQSRLETSEPLTPQGGYSMSQGSTHRPNLRRAVFIVLAGLVLVVLAAATPAGRSLAQQVLGYFVRSESEAFDLPPAQLTAVAPAQEAAVAGEDTDLSLQPTAAPPAFLVTPEGCENADPEVRYACLVTAAEEQVGFPIQVVPPASDLLEFNNLYVNQNTNSVQISYGFTGHPGTENSLWLFQGQGEFPEGSEWEQVPEAYIEAVQVGEFPGEYVAGNFIHKPGVDQATWTAEVPMARLRWREGDRWFELFKAGQPEPLTKAVDKAGLLKLARELSEVQPK